MLRVAGHVKCRVRDPSRAGRGPRHQEEEEGEEDLGPEEAKDGPATAAPDGLHPHGSSLRSRDRIVEQLIYSLSVLYFRLNVPIFLVLLNLLKMFS